MLQWMNLTSIKYKFLLVALIGGIGFSSYLAFNYASAKTNESHIQQIMNISAPVQQHIGHIWIDLFAARNQLTAAISDGEEDLLKEGQQSANQLQQRLQEIQDIAPEYKGDIERLKQTFNSYFLVAHKMSKGMLDGTLNMDTLPQTAAAMNSHYSSFNQQLSDFRNQSYKNFEHRLQNANQNSQDSVTAGLIIGLATIAMLLAAAWLIGSLVVKDLNRVIHSLSDMATGKGDLTLRLKSTNRDEIGQLVNQFNAFVTHLQLMIKVMANLSHGVSEGALKVNSIALQTQDGILKQQGEIQMVASAVTQMSATAQEVAGNASEAAVATGQAHSDSENGQQVVTSNIQAINALAEEVTQAQEVIQSLAKESEQIGSVTDVIRGIAEQTNLLALNAAIEAARAGEQGRGFAVVADEVRTLAARTGQSTSEIQQIIERLQQSSQKAVAAMQRSQDGAAQGVEKSQLTGRSLESIMKSVQTINDMNTLVATSAREQHQVAEEVSGNIVRINEVSDNTASAAQDTTIATDSLSSKAENLLKIVNEFKV